MRAQTPTGSPERAGLVWKLGDEKEDVADGGGESLRDSLSPTNGWKPSSSPRPNSGRRGSKGSPKCEPCKRARKGRSRGNWPLGFDWATRGLEGWSSIPARETGIRRVAFGRSKAGRNHRARSSRQDVKIAQCRASRF